MLSLDVQAGFPKVAVTALMATMLVVIYPAVRRGRLGPYVASMLALATMLSLVSFYFTSYMVWLIPFLLLAVAEAVERSGPPPPTGDGPADDAKLP